jgi:Condensation domain
LPKPPKIHSQKAPVVAATSLTETERSLLDKYLRNTRRSASVSAPPSARRPSAGAAPLSLPQEQLFDRGKHSASEPPFYNEVITIHRKGPLEAAVIERSLLEIIRRHEIWRTTFGEADGRPVQVVHAAPVDLRLPVLDLTGLSKSEQEARVFRCVRELTECPFDLRRGPLLRFLLIRLGDLSHRLVLVAHQSIVDGVSAYQVLPTELAALYQAFSNGNPSPLPEPPIQFADYAVWQRNRVKVEENDQDLRYWRNRLAGELPVLQWPEGWDRAKSYSHRGQIRPFAFTKKVSEALRSTAKREGVTLFMTLLSGFVTLLRGYTNQEDILVGTLSPAGRKRTELQELLGYFLNPVTLRFDLSSNPTFGELLQQTREVVSEAISHDEVPLEVLSKKLGLASSTEDPPPFSVAISLQPRVPEALRPEWDVTSMDAGNGGTMWNLYLAFIDSPDGVIGRAQYNSDIFQEETIAQMLTDLETLFERLTSQPHSRLSDFHKRDDSDKNEGANHPA